MVLTYNVQVSPISCGGRASGMRPQRQEPNTGPQIHPSAFQELGPASGPPI